MMNSEEEFQKKKKKEKKDLDVEEVESQENPSLADEEGWA